MTIRPLDVLLADDEALGRRIVALLLRQAGHRVQEASDGAGAVSAATAARFDLVLLDVAMPGIDGPTAARAIRALPDGDRPVILALTASPWPEVIAACRDAGMDGCLSKPVALPQVMAAMAATAAGAGWRVAAVAEPSYPLLDTDHLAALAEGIPPALFRASLDACLASLAQSAAGLERLAAAPDAKAGTALAHKLRGTAATYGLAALRHRLGEVEEATRRGETPSDATLARLAALLAGSREALARYAAPR